VAPFSPHDELTGILRLFEGVTPQSTDDVINRYRTILSNAVDYRLNIRGDYVNRIWHWLFGAGLVATTDDFGHVGDKPSHPELLDALAWRFMNEGWSTKRLIRSIILSQTWQQSQDASPRALDVDPTNRLMHHFPVQRLDAESLRDAMLAVSDRLDATLFGPTTNPSRLSKDDQKRLFSGPLDGLGRRSIYTRITIMEPPRFLATFNQPAPKIPTGRRDISNTPTQSLALLNDPFVTNQAEVWAAEPAAAYRQSHRAGTKFRIVGKLWTWNGEPKFARLRPAEQ